MPREAGPSSDEERIEQLREALFGQLDELVAEAEDLVEENEGAVVPENPDTAQLWEELREQYRLAGSNLENRRESIDEETRLKLAELLKDLKERAEAAFGVPLTGAGELHALREKYEELTQAVIGDFDEAVWSAESVKEYFQAAVMPTGHPRAEVEWKKVQAAYAASRDELKRRKDTLEPEIFDLLQRTFDELKRHAETIFGGQSLE